MSCTILFVDDEPHILTALGRLFLDEPYRLLTASSPEAALELIKENAVAVVVSDHRMPGMAGTELLEKIGRMQPDCVRIMMTGYADMEAAVAAINLGHVYRFISKPWDESDLKAAVRNAVARYELAEENKRLLALTRKQNVELQQLNQNLESMVEERTGQIRSLMEVLEKSFHQSIRLFLGLLELFSPDLLGHVKRTAAMAVEIARRHGLDSKEVQLIETAALLHDVGLIGLPVSLLAKAPERMSKHEIALILQHPSLGHATLAEIDGLREAAVLVHAHHENNDGTGYPLGLKGSEIPAGARIIRLANDLDNLVTKNGLSREKAVEHLKSGIGRFYDADAVAALLDASEQIRSSSLQERTVRLADLESGMVLAGPIKTHQGLLLLAEGTTLQPELIEKLNRFHKVDPIVDCIRIQA